MEHRPNILGFLAMLAAMVLLPVADALAKLMTAGYSAEQIIWIRNLVHAVIVLPLALRGGRGVPLGPLHLLRGLAFVLMAVPYVAALYWMPLADGQALLFTFPLMVMAVSALALGQQVGPVRWGAAVAGMVGVLLIVQPGFRTFTPGIPLALLSAVGAAAYILLTRRLAGSASQLMLLAMPALFSVVALLPVVPWRWVTPGAADLGILLVIGALATLIHLLLIVAYSRVEPSVIAPLAYLQIAVGVVLGWWIFGDLPGPVAATGMIIVVASGVVISVREHRRR